MSDESSRRAKKRVVSKGLRELTSKPGWNPATFRRQTPEDALEALQSQTRQDQTYAEADTCTACAAERNSTGDATALCETHLMEAMGL